MSKFTRYFGISKAQSELDFVDIELDGDLPLYVDPYALTTRDDDWSIRCQTLVVSFFEAVLDVIRSGKRKTGITLLSHLGEPEETHLGVSRDGNKGRGIGSIQAEELYDALVKSIATTSGLLQDLPDIALFIPGIGRDKISDMTTNIIRKALIEYTQMQCKLLGISMQHVPSGFLWDPDKGKWTQEYVDLPICNGEKIILIPKYTVRYQVGVDHATYRSKFVLEFLKAEHLRADDALVTAIKNKKGEITKKVVHKKTVDDYYPKDKEFLAKFSAENPKIVEDYRESLKLLASKIPDIGSGEVTERDLAAHLAANLKDIPPGFKSANNYHNLIIGIISFIYFPNLIYPQKEAEINEGRKRIDITYTNGKDFGFFYRIAIDQDIKANIVHVECKNYSNDIANPEFDQLIGRFDRTRGRLGLLFYRKSEGQAEVIRRCRDAAKSGLGIILPIDDEFVLKALQFIEQGKRDHIDRQIDELFRNVTA